MSSSTKAQPQRLQSHVKLRFMGPGQMLVLSLLFHSLDSGSAITGTDVGDLLRAFC